MEMEQGMVWSLIEEGICVCVCVCVCVLPRKKKIRKGEEFGREKKRKEKKSALTQGLYRFAE